MTSVTIGVGGPVGSGKTALARQPLQAAAGSLQPRGRHERHLHPRGRRVPDALRARCRSSGFAACRPAAARTPRSARTRRSTTKRSTRCAAAFPDVEIIFLESGGDNLAASFSPELVDVSIYVIDVAGGDKVPRKGGPGVTRSDLLVINKIDLAPHVGADLGVMARDAAAIRDGQAGRLHQPEGRRRAGSGDRLDHGTSPVRGASLDARARRGRVS